MSVETLTIEVKGGPKGQKRSKSIQVEQFGDLSSALGFLGLTDGNGKLTEYGNTYLLQAINSQRRRNMESRARASLCQITSKRLGKLAKNDPELRSKLNLLLSELDLPQL